MTDAVIEQLTAPGGPFEFIDAEVGGVRFRQFRDTPPYLSILYKALPTFADRTFVVYEDRQLTFADVTGQAAALGKCLRDEHGIKPGDRVAIVMRNAPEWIVSFIAVTSIGGVAVLVNSRGTGDELAFCVESTDCAFILADRRCATALDETSAAGIPKLVSDVATTKEGGQGSLDEVLRAAPTIELETTPREPDEPALILFTSGTTGKPKGAQLTHRGVTTAVMTNQYSNAVIGARMAAQYGIDLETLAANRPQPCTLLMFPLFHVSGCHSVLLPAIGQGGKIVLMKRWNAERTLQLIDAEKITTFPGVPTMHWDLLQVPDRDKYDLSSLSAISIGGQATPLTLLRAIQEAFPTAVLGTGYGMTETNGALTLAIGEDLVNYPTSAGKAVATTELRLKADDDSWSEPGETGEICVRSATVMSGYFDRPDANAESFTDGWFRTGDVGYFDDEDRLYIVDRVTDMVISGGENIYCAEVERTLSQHPAVVEAVTFGVPDDRLGEKLVAMVRPKDGQSVTADEIAAFVGEHLAAYKVPGTILVVTDPLPRNPAGKVPKNVARDLFLSSQ